MRKSRRAEVRVAHANVLLSHAPHSDIKATRPTKHAVPSSSAKHVIKHLLGTVLTFNSFPEPPEVASSLLPLRFGRTHAMWKFPPLLFTPKRTPVFFESAHASPRGSLLSVCVQLTELTSANQHAQRLPGHVIARALRLSDGPSVSVG
jgi:hypothetical protein